MKGKERFIIATRTKNINEHKAAQQYAFNHGFLWHGNSDSFEDHRDKYDENIWYRCDADTGWLYYCCESFYKDSNEYKDYKVVYVTNNILMETE